MMARFALAVMDWNENKHRRKLVLDETGRRLLLVFL
jgi:hypothetical protein